MQSLPVLASRSSVQVNDDLESMRARPADRLLEVRQLAGDVRLTRPNLECPVSDGNADVVEAKRMKKGVNGDPALHGHVTYPALAMLMKSCSVIHVFQWLCSAASAVFRFCSCPNVHSSTIAEFPVWSNRLGVSQG